MCPGASRLNAISPGDCACEQQQRHAAERPALEALLERMQADLHLRVLPQQHVVLEIDGNLPVEHHVQHRHELALEPVADPGCGALGICVGRIFGGGRHLVLLIRWVRRGDRAPRTGPASLAAH